MDKQQRALPVLLNDMRTYARKALGFVGSMDWDQFAMSEREQFAVVRCLEIIGEAANQIPREFQSQHPSIPWTIIVGMRNRLIHGYAEVDMALCWRTIQEDLPSLIDEIELLPGADSWPDAQPEKHVADQSRGDDDDGGGMPPV